MRRYRRMLEGGISLLGVLAIFAGLLIVPDDSVQLQIFVVLAGILALEAGVWGMAQRLLPNDRQFVDLRVEGEHFIDLVRALNEAAIESNRGAADATAHPADADARFQEVLALMHASVERLGEVAGKVS